MTDSMFVVPDGRDPDRGEEEGGGGHTERAQGGVAEIQPQSRPGQQGNQVRCSLLWHGGSHLPQSRFCTNVCVY
jgi:hypothetical protein